MAKKRKYKSYDDLLKRVPEFAGVISPSAWWLIGYSDSVSVKGLKERWGNQLEENIDSGLWKKHGGATVLKGFGKDKAVIAVGAGPSLKKNQDVLTMAVTVDGVKDWPDRNFITIASNHQFKP